MFSQTQKQKATEYLIFVASSFQFYNKKFEKFGKICVDDAGYI